MLDDRTQMKGEEGIIQVQEGVPAGFGGRKLMHLVGDCGSTVSSEILS